MPRLLPAEVIMFGQQNAELEMLALMRQLTTQLVACVYMHLCCSIPLYALLLGIVVPHQKACSDTISTTAAVNQVLTNKQHMIV